MVYHIVYYPDCKNDNFCNNIMINLNYLGKFSGTDLRVGFQCDVTLCVTGRN